MLCANADELPTRLYCFTLQFVTQSTRNQPSTPSQTRSKGSSFSHTAPQLCQGDAQLQLCTFTKKNHQCTSNTAQEATEVALLPPQIWSLTLQFLRASGGKDANCSHFYELPELKLSIKKRSVGKSINLHLTQERRCCHRALYGSAAGDPKLKDFHMVREHPAFLSLLIPIPLSRIWLKPHVFVLW